MFKLKVACEVYMPEDTCRKKSKELEIPLTLNCLNIKTLNGDFIMFQFLLRSQNFLSHICELFLGVSF